MPVLLSQILPVGLIGLVGAGMLAAFMSTHDSYLLCWSSVLVQDVIAPTVSGELSTKTRLLLARILIFVIGMFLLVWSLWYPLGQDLWDYMAVSGAIYFTGAFAVLLAGIYWKRASTVGAYLALAAGSCAVLGLKPVKDGLGLARLEDAWNIRIGSEQVGLATTVLALVLMFVGSLAFPDRKKDRSDENE
jgi:SSS family solute:Na+ symporter